MLGEEGYFGIVDAQCVCGEVDTALMTFLLLSSTPQIYGTHKLTSMSKPNSRSTDRPSSTENEQGRYRLPSLICAECTRPRIRAVPTPIAIPANRVSRSRIMLLSALMPNPITKTTHPQASAHSGDTGFISLMLHGSTSRPTYGSLCSGIHKRLDRMTVHLNIDIQHMDVAECFRLRISSHINQTDNQSLQKTP